MAMLLRGFLAVAVLAAGVGLSARFLLTDVPPATGLGDPGVAATIALAPLSLGNPAAAAALKVRHPDTPLGAPSVAREPPAYGYPLRVAPGDTLAGLLVGAGIPRDEAHGAVTALGKLFDPRRIRPGQEITVRFPPGARRCRRRPLPGPDRGCRLSAPDCRYADGGGRLPGGRGGTGA